MVKLPDVQKNPATIQLWRHILKWTRLMPKAQSDYYRTYAKQHIWAHMDDVEPERHAFLLKMGYQNTEWIVQKYGLDKMKQNGPGGHAAAQQQQAQAEATPNEASSGSEDAERRKVDFSNPVGSSPLPAVSRSLKGLVVEKDVIGQLILKEVEAKAREKTRGLLKMGDVLVEIDGESVRGVDPHQLAAFKLSHTFKFGRRKAGGGAEYFEITLTDT